MIELQSFSLRDIGGRERLEDYVADEVVMTAGGLFLHVIIVSDGAGGGDAGERASRLTVRTILDSLYVSQIDTVPRLLVNAVEGANRVVYSELSGTGTSTVAIVAVDLNDSDYGRAYIASVGNSRIYLIREREMVRLNVDHTLANEYVIAGQMSPNEATRLENADYPTRVIGVNPDIQVDIGFYAERGNPFVNAQRAFNIGKRGMALREGDTMFVASEGVFNTSDDGNRTIVTHEEFLRHAMDDDVERAARALLRYGSNRNPTDNLSLALLFVPSRHRRRVVVTRLSPRQRIAAAAASMVFGVVVFMLAVSLINQQRNIREQNRLIAQVAAYNTALAASPTPLPSSTPTATPTNTPTPTLVPTKVDEVRQVAVQLYGPDDPDRTVIFRNDLVTSPDERSLLIIDGPRFDPAQSQNANFYFQPQSQLVFSAVEGSFGSEHIDSLFYSNSDLYAYAGSFINGGVRFRLDRYPDVELWSRSLCFSMRQIPANREDPEDFDKLAFTCLAGPDGNCTYRFGDTLPNEMPTARRVLLNLETSELVTDEEPPLYEEMRTYYDTVVELSGNENDLACLRPHLDIDNDGIAYPNDLCENDPGGEITQGCPDTDGDGIADRADECINEPGLVDFNGCPAPTPTPLPDIDGDGLTGTDDLCPAQEGPASNDGCPIDELPPETDPVY